MNPEPISEKDFFSAPLTEKKDIMASEEAIKKEEVSKEMVEGANVHKEKRPEVGKETKGFINKYTLNLNIQPYTNLWVDIAELTPEAGAELTKVATAMSNKIKKLKEDGIISK